MSFSLIYFVCSIDYLKIITAYIYFYILLFLYISWSFVIEFYVSIFWSEQKAFHVTKSFLYRFDISYFVVTCLHGVPDERKLFVFCQNAFNNHLPGTTTAVITTFLPVIGRRMRNDKFPLLIFCVPHYVFLLSLITKENKALTAKYWHFKNTLVIFSPICTLHFKEKCYCKLQFTYLLYHILQKNILMVPENN